MTEQQSPPILQAAAKSLAAPAGESAQADRARSERAIRVLIATTEGPVTLARLEYWETEDKDLQSMMCRYRETSVVGVSSQYDDFVQPGTGVIDALYRRPGARNRARFRADVAGPIDVGDSWQAAMLLAHAAFAENRLAEQDQPAAIVAWATGKLHVDDLSVAPVDAVADKLRRSLPAFRDAAAACMHVLAFIPAANMADIDADLRDRLRAVGVDLIAVQNAAEMQRTLGLRERAPPGRKGREHSPFRGLEPFEPEHQHVFFGRDDAIETAAAKLCGNAVADGCAFLLITGQSGAGKSSMARAGLLGRPERLDQSARWLTAIMFPQGADGATPMGRLASCLMHVVPGLARPAGDADVVVGLPEAALADRVAACLAAAGRGSFRLLLLIDQLELLFAAPVTPAERETFVAALSALARSGAVWVVGTIRSDHFHLIENSPELVKLASIERCFRLLPPTRAALSDIIARSLALADLAFNDAPPDHRSLAQVLEDEAAGRDGCLPLLEFVFDRLFELRRSRGRLLWGDYRRLDGLGGAIANFADGVVEKLGGSARNGAALEAIIRGLARIDPVKRLPVAQPVPVVRLAPPNRPERVHLLEALVAARLVVTDLPVADSAGPGRDTVARVAHEALLTHWQAAREILARDAEDLLRRDQIEQQANVWNRHAARGRGDLLLRGGVALVRARDLLRRRGADDLLSPEATAFIQASQSRTLRIRMMMGAAVILIAAASMSAVFRIGKDRQDLAAAKGLYATARDDAANLVRAAQEEAARRTEAARVRNLALIQETLTSKVEAYRQTARTQLGGRRVDLAVQALSDALGSWQKEQAVEPGLPDEPPELRASLVQDLGFALEMGGYDAEMAVPSDLHPRWLWPVRGSAIAVAGGDFGISLFDLGSALRVADLHFGREIAGLQPVQDSPDGRFLLLTGTRGEARVADLRQRLFVLDWSDVVSARLYAGGRKIAARTGQGVLLSDIDGSESKAKWIGDAGETLTRYNPELDPGDHVILHGGHTIRSVDPETGEETSTVDMPGNVIDAGPYGAGGGYGFDDRGNVRLFDPACACTRRSFSVGSSLGPDAQVIVTPDDTRAVVVNNGAASLWDTTTGKRLAQLADFAKGAHVRLRFLSGGHLLLLDIGNQQASVFDTSKGAARCALAHDDRLLTAAPDGFLLVQRATNPPGLLSGILLDADKPCGADQPLLPAFHDPDAGSLIATVGAGPSHVIMLASETAAQAYRISANKPALERTVAKEVKDYRAAKMASDGKVIAIAASGHLALYDSWSRAMLAQNDLPMLTGDGTTGILLSPDETRVAVGDGEALVLLSYPELRVTGSWPAHGAVSWAFSPDSKRLAIFDAGHGVQLIDPRSGSTVADVAIERAANLTMPGDGPLVVQDADGTLDLVDWSDGRILRQLRIPGGVRSFAHEGNDILAAGPSGIWRIDSRTGSEVWRNTELSDVRLVDIAPAGGLLAALSGSNAVSLVSTRDGSVVLKPPAALASGAEITQIRFPDTGFLLIEMKLPAGTLDPMTPPDATPLDTRASFPLPDDMVHPQGPVYQVVVLQGWSIPLPHQDDPVTHTVLATGHLPSTISVGSDWFIVHMGMGYDTWDWQVGRRAPVAGAVPYDGRGGYGLRYTWIDTAGDSVLHVSDQGLTVRAVRTERVLTQAMPSLTPLIAASQTFDPRKFGLPDGQIPGDLLARLPALQPAPDACARLAAVSGDQQVRTVGVDMADIDPQQAIPACEAVLRSNPEDGAAWLHLGRAQAAAGLRQQAIGSWQKAVDRGEVEAMSLLGVATTRGSGLPQDYVAGARLLEDAMMKGSGSAALYLVGLYAVGEGVPRDLSVGWGLMSEAAVRGDVVALSDVGQIGGAAQDLRVAILQAARARGYDLATVSLADDLLAVARADRQSDDDAAVGQARLRAKGFDPASIPDPAAAALGMLTNAAEHGHVASTVRLADLLTEKNGVVAADPLRARDLYMRAARARNARAAAAAAHLWDDRSPDGPDAGQALLWAFVAIRFGDADQDMIAMVQRLKQQVAPAAGQIMADAWKIGDPANNAPKPP